jgi:hypothetical protein
MVLAISAAVYAQIPLSYTVGSGSWRVSGDRLYQTDENAKLAKVNLKIPQEGPMVYEFNARYEAGGEDGHGGFGIHVFGDRAVDQPSWGSGRSYLLWLNYDEDPSDPKIPAGLSAQIYRSLTHSYMEMVESVDLNNFADEVTDEDLDYPVPFRIYVDGSNGEVRVYDPTDIDMSEYYYFYINPREIPIKGEWVSLRTNGANLSFGLGL